MVPPIELFSQLPVDGSITMPATTVAAISVPSGTRLFAVSLMPLNVTCTVGPLRTAVAAPLATADAAPRRLTVPTAIAVLDRIAPLALAGTTPMRAVLDWLTGALRF